MVFSSPPRLLVGARGAVAHAGVQQGQCASGWLWEQVSADRGSWDSKAVFVIVVVGVCEPRGRIGEVQADFGRTRRSAGILPRLDRAVVKIAELGSQ